MDSFEAERAANESSASFISVRDPSVPLLFAFAFAVALNAFLLFAVEPLVARLILPLLGGTPAVWNTCVVFFQAVLLAGYAFAHFLATRLAFRTQVLAYPALALAVLFLLPIRIGSTHVPSASNPIPWLLALLVTHIGPPFFIIATTGPLLQKWFANTDQPAARDPYFLYATSNFGSMAALLAYPVLLEPNFGLMRQSDLWTAGYASVTVLVAGCAWLALGRLPKETDCGVKLSEHAEPIALSRKLRWVGLAFVPSSLMLGVTTYLSTDIATIPLLWIVPLALYLLSFVIVFARRPLLPHWIVGRMVPIGVLALTVLLLADDLQPPIALTIVVHLLVFLVAALFCHGELARDRPLSARLTEYYLWLALGGVLGGVFNALIAPVLFSRIFEYPLALVALCFFRHSSARAKRTSLQRRLDYLLPLALGGIAAAMILWLPSHGWSENQINLALMFGLPGVLCYGFEPRRFRFALGVAAIMLAGRLYTGGEGNALHTERSFFGVLRVTEDRSHRFYQLVHGNTIHGRRRIDGQGIDGRSEPLSYYHRDGPVGQVFARVRPRFPHARIGVIGLGVGAMAWYARPDEEWTFYEIDPAVERLARNTTYFTFLHECRAKKLNIVTGDARLRLREVPDRHFDLLFLDAFSSDAVPVHLLTREAIEVYRQKLTPDGVLVFHLSNRFLDLRPVLADLARDAKLVCRCRDDLGIPREETDQGRDPCQWAMMVPSPQDFGSLRHSIFWEDLNKTQPVGTVWRDDYANVLGIFKWFDWSRD